MENNQIEMNLNIPVKPKINFGVYGNEYITYCGVCGGVIEEDYICCPYCTETIDWTDYKEEVVRQLKNIKEMFSESSNNDG